MGKVIAGFIVVGIAILFMLAETLFGVQEDWPFLAGLWIGVVGLMLINSKSREEDRKRRKILEKRMEEREKEKETNSPKNESVDELNQDHADKNQPDDNAKKSNF